MFKYYLSKIIPFSILPIAVLSVQRFSYSPIGSTSVWWLVEILILMLFGIASFVLFESENRRYILIFQLYLVWNIFSIVRGFFAAETYWDYKGLVENTLALLLPVVVFAATNRRILQSILSFYMKYVLIFAIVVFPFLPLGAWGWYLFPVSFLLLFFPVFQIQWKSLLLVIALIAMFADISSRSLIFKFGIPLLLLFFYYFRAFPEAVRILKFSRVVFLFAPFVLFFLAVSGIFNVFQINEYFKVEGNTGKQSLNEDSRTFIYKEVLESAQKYNYWWLGRTPARGNETVAFADAVTEVGMRRERLRNEANIPNVFTWNGIIGVILYFLIFYKASSLAVYKSNNIFSKLIGVFIAFRWLYSWIEDFYVFNLNNFVIWLMIGICFSESFRRMNNLEVKLWARAIFQKRYLEAYRVFVLKLTP
ncbi:hypothetical protein GM418_09705 [Maribellus comscasis]|uniref:O-antigen ligase domain-containing protein n=1 Tax=Maribellus comscasis TaxID=2681766 RepID=A0A6I6JNA8_9BACT|nr:hypothetical protein [Maribellus comscasis]QGY43921.1 hypothetical protein GM418_09705 [Maribellus comscasis]